MPPVILSFSTELQAFDIINNYAARPWGCTQTYLLYDTSNPSNMHERGTEGSSDMSGLRTN